MKYYVYGFTAESGEFFALSEYGYDGNKLYCTAENAAEAAKKFENYANDEYITDETAPREMTNNDIGLLTDNPDRFICID